MSRDRVGRDTAVSRSTHRTHASRFVHRAGDSRVLPYQDHRASIHWLATVTRHEAGCCPSRRRPKIWPHLEQHQ